jgi:predicted nucleic acid-binding protein
MARHLLDTNHLGRCLDRVSRLRERIRAAHRQGHRLATCVPALCELHVFIAGSRDPAAARRVLRELLTIVRIWPIDPPVAERYADIVRDLRSRGRILSQVDMMLAALARETGATLLTTDRDFEALPDLRCENWLADPP